MPEATILYSVTGTVVAGLVVWVIMVLNTAKQPWVRIPEEAPAAEEEPAAVVAADEKPAAAVAKSDDDVAGPDDTARQTPVALSTGRAKAAKAEEVAEKAEEQSEPDEKKADA